MVFRSRDGDSVSGEGGWVDDADQSVVVGFFADESALSEDLECLSREEVGGWVAVLSAFVADAFHSECAGVFVVGVDFDGVGSRVKDDTCVGGVWLEDEFAQVEYPKGASVFHLESVGIGEGAFCLQLRPVSPKRGLYVIGLPHFTRPTEGSVF